MVALVRYLAADALRSQRWVAPLLVFLAGVAIFNMGAGPVLTTYADTATLLLPVGVWLTVVVANSEDPQQAGITAVTVGGLGRARVGKLLTALCGCGLLAMVALAWPFVAHSFSGQATVGDVAAGAAAHLCVAVFAVAVGSYGARAVLARAGLRVLWAALWCLGDVAVPHAPPTRRILEIFDHTRGTALVGPLTVVAAATAVLSAGLVAASSAVAARRA